MSPFDLNIRHLVAHAAIVSTGSISGAARRIHLSQPAVTQGVAKLERQFDSALFVRRPGGMQPTDAGRALASRVEAMQRLMGVKLATCAQIRAFLALARAGTYRLASAATGLSEASLHRAVADLGVAQGSQLIERRGRSMMLTRRGRDAQRRFTLAMAEIESAIVEVTALSGREIGRVAVGAMPLSRSSLLPEAITHFQRLRPEVAISVIEGSHADLIGPLRDGSIAMMVGALRTDPGADLQTTALFRDTPIIVGRSGHPLTSASTLTAQNLGAYPWIVPAPGTPLRDLWSQMFEALGATPPRVLIECGSALTIRQLLVRSDHLTLFSADQIALELETGRLAKIGTAPSQFDRTIGITTRADWRPTATQICFIEMLEKAAVTCGIR